MNLRNLEPRAIQFEAQLRRAKSISECLYGVSWGTWMPLAPDEMLNELRPATVRAGGNLMSRYNWRSSRYSDDETKAVVQQPSIVDFARSCRRVGAEPVIQLNALEWAPDEHGNFRHCLSVEDQIDLLKHLRDNGQEARYVEIDNECFIWHWTHEEVWERPISSREYLERFFVYAERIKSEFPEVIILAPAVDTEVLGYNSHFPGDDYGGYGGFLEFMLERCRAHENDTGRRLLDCFTIHNYACYRKSMKDPEIIPGGIERQLAATQILWNDGFKDYCDARHPPGVSNVFGGLRRLLDRHYPGTYFGITEYNLDPYSGYDKIPYDPRLRPLWLADYLGILAQEGVFQSHYFHLWGWDDDGLALAHVTRAWPHQISMTPMFDVFKEYSSSFKGDYVPVRNGLDNGLSDLFKIHCASRGERHYALFAINKSAENHFRADLFVDGRNYRCPYCIPPLSFCRFDFSDGQFTPLKRVF